MTELNKRRLGRTGLMVTELGLGGFQFTGEFGVPRAVAFDIMDLAFRSGINFVDSAPMYGFGESEELVGRGTEKAGGQIYISTKVGWLDRTIVRNLGDEAYRDEAAIRRVVEHSMRLLGRSYLDIVMVHEPEWKQWGLDPDTGDGVILTTLERLKKEGVIGAIGMGGGHLDVMTRLAETGRFDVLLTFMHYDLAVQDAKERLLPAAKKHDMGVILGGPFRQGALAVKQEARIAEMRRTGEYPWGFNEEVVRKIDHIYKLADETGIPLAEMGVRYLLSDPQVSTVIPGPRKVEELESNLEAARKGPLPEDVLEQIRKI
ncbi:aldo/keto reductase [Paenibacillus sp.]|uniref:aldo/keto reductase n=1 Tax=Paenibacillus sp. TaxID=58172 RepID=UPI002D5EF832|nr:aldo/keto reductase [Paenibacillus sp.]HZG83382.1 aldo/keto reductase [Paenibacillus sp.]